MKRCFIDTGALLALASTRDQYHARAVQTEERLRKSGVRWASTMMVLGEFHGHLIRRIDPEPARRTVQAVLSDPLFEWHDVSGSLIQNAVDRWMLGYRDQRFSLTDAASFELMRRERISSAFAFDAHFVAAGYDLLD